MDQPISQTSLFSAAPSTRRNVKRRGPSRSVEQLTLLDGTVGRRRPVLDERTCRIGLEGVATVRAKLAEQAARRAEREALLDGRFIRHHAA